MKKFLMLSLLLSAINVGAREMILEEGPSTPSPLCVRFSEETLTKIYSEASRVLKISGNLLTNHRIANTDCNNKYSAQANQDIGMTIKEGNAIYAQCDQKNILTQEQLEQTSVLYNQLTYVGRFESAKSFLNAHLTNLSIPCETIYARIERLKQLLNL